MTDFGLGNRKITENFEVVLPSGRKTDFTRAKTQYIRYNLQMQKTDFANSSVVLNNELEMLAKLRILAEKEGYLREFIWIDKRINEIKVQITQSKVETFANAYYQPIFSTSAAERQKEALDPESDLMKLLNSCKISETEFDVNAERIFNAYKDKDVDVYHLGYLIKTCRDDKTGIISEQMADAVCILADNDVECRLVPQFLEDNTVYDYDSRTPIINFAALKEVAEFKEKGINDVEVLKYQRLLRQNNFIDREKIKGFIFKFKDIDMPVDHTITILDSLKYNLNSSDYNTEEQFDIDSDSIETVFRLKKVLVSTRNNEVAERKIINSNSEDDIFSWSVMEKEEDAPEEIKKKYDEAIEALEDNLLAEFAKKYKQRDGKIDSKYLRVLTALRSAGVVYSSIMKLMPLCIDNRKEINQENINCIRKAKSAEVISSQIPTVMEKCRKNEDGTYDDKDLQTVINLSKAGYESQRMTNALCVIRPNPETEDFYVECGHLFKDKGLIVTKIRHLALDKQLRNFDENSMNVIIELAKNIKRNNPYMSDGDVVKEIEIVMNGAKSPNTGCVSDEAAGICVILRDKCDLQNIKRALVACSVSKGVYSTVLSDILWNMAYKGADIKDILNVIFSCRGNDKVKTINNEKAQVYLNMLESGVNVQDIIADAKKK